MGNENFLLKNLEQLDPYSYDDVDKIIVRYEDTRDKLTGQLIRNYGEEALRSPAAYKNLDEFYADLPQTKDIKRRRAILAQMKEEFAEDVQ